MRLVADVGIALGRGVELLFEHALVHRADRELRPPEHLGLDPPRVAEGVVGDDPAGPPADLLGAVSPFVEIVALTPLASPVRVVHRHPDHRDRRMDSRERPYARDPAPGAHNHPAVDLLAQDGVRAADVAGPLRGDGGGFDPEAKLAKRLRGIEHALVARAAPRLERHIEVFCLDLDAQDARLEQAERLAEELLAGLIAVQDGDRRCGHRIESYGPVREGPGQSGSGGEQRADLGDMTAEAGHDGDDVRQGAQFGPARVRE